MHHKEGLAPDFSVQEQIQPYLLTGNVMPEPTFREWVKDVWKPERTILTVSELVEIAKQGGWIVMEILTQNPDQPE